MQTSMAVNEFSDGKKWLMNASAVSEVKRDVRQQQHRNRSFSWKLTPARVLLQSSAAPFLRFFYYVAGLKEQNCKNIKVKSK